MVPVLKYQLSRAGNNPQWTSIITVLNNMILGTITTPEFSGIKHEVIALNRFDDGAKSGRDPILWRAPTDDDSVNTLVPGPDGAIYVPNYGLIDLMLPGKSTWQGGITKFVPVKKEFSRARLR